VLFELHLLEILDSIIWSSNATVFFFTFFIFMVFAFERAYFVNTVAPITRTYVMPLSFVDSLLWERINPRWLLHLIYITNQIK
jgi:hypothetical protein